MTQLMASNKRAGVSRLATLNACFIAAYISHLALVVATQAADRPSLPQTFVPLELDKFPTLSGSCDTATNVLLVGPTRTYKTIAAAIAVATPFTVIKVDAGRYVENDPGSGGSDNPQNPEGWYALSIVMDDICIIGSGPSSTRLLAAANKYQKNGLLVSGQRFTLKGVGVEGFAAGIALGGSDGKTQQGIVIADVAVIGRTDGWSNGIVHYADPTATTGGPALDGLLLYNVSLRLMTLGVSCNTGPCEHLWLHKVSVSCINNSPESSGADAFAVEKGRQVIITQSRFSGASGDGIDIKGSDVLIWKSNVVNVMRNGIKLWQGGDVQNCIINGTGADSALAGGTGGRYRYSKTQVLNHNRGQQAYVGAWGYNTKSVFNLEFRSCIFKDNSLRGGLYVPVVAGTRLRFINNIFYDVGEKLLETNLFTIMISADGIQDLESRGYGSGNRLGV